MYFPKIVQSKKKQFLSQMQKHMPWLSRRKRVGQVLNARVSYVHSVTIAAIECATFSYLSFREICFGVMLCNQNSSMQFKIKVIACLFGLANDSVIRTFWRNFQSKQFTQIRKPIASMFFLVDINIFAFSH